MRPPRAKPDQDRCRTASIQAEKGCEAMPENSPNFTTIKRWILEAAADSNMVMSTRRAKKMAGDYLDSQDPANYKRLAYNDPVGEGVARRWDEFKHNMAAVSA
jgi:hypothetical protein